MPSSGGKIAPGKGRTFVLGAAGRGEAAPRPTPPRSVGGGHPNVVVEVIQKDDAYLEILVYNGMGVGGGGGWRVSLTLQAVGTPSCPGVPTP